jgi:uncharacterized protein YjbI with pentapeptide repeats
MAHNQLKLIREGVEVWNNWRKNNAENINLVGADLSQIDLSGADLKGANLSKSIFYKTNLVNASLDSANLFETNLTKANLTGATLKWVRLTGSDLSKANLSNTDLYQANLFGSDFFRTDLTYANLTEANLQRASFVETNIEHAILNRCKIYGLSAWNMKGKPKEQSSLVISPDEEAGITVDDFEVAQFIYLLLDNKNVRNVIDTITTKVVLILGRFTEERKVILDTLHDELRKRNYLPMLFDFSKPSNRDITETVSILAHLAKFVIADITDAKSIPQELHVIVPALPSVPVQPLLLYSQREYGMFEHFRRFPWVLPIYLYQNIDDVVSALSLKILPALERKLEVSKNGEESDTSTSE